MITISKKDRELLYKAIHDVIMNERLSLMKDEFSLLNLDVRIAQLALKIWDKQKVLFYEPKQRKTTK